MSTGQIERLLAAVSDKAAGPLRERVDGYAAASRRCDERISARRAELARALRDAAEADRAAEAVDAVIRLAGELDVLERVQPRIDSLLRLAVRAVVDDQGPSPFGEGPA
jgi:hypothetical protein